MFAGPRACGPIHGQRPRTLERSADSAESSSAQEVASVGGCGGWGAWRGTTAGFGLRDVRLRPMATSQCVCENKNRRRNRFVGRFKMSAECVVCRPSA